MTIPTITNTTTTPYSTTSGTDVSPFADVTIADPPQVIQGFPYGGQGVLSITITGDPAATVSVLNDGVETGSWDASTQTLTQNVGVAPQLPLQLEENYVLQHDVVNIPALAPGQNATIDVWVSFRTPYYQVAETPVYPGLTVPAYDVSDPSPIVIDEGRLCKHHQA